MPLIEDIARLDYIENPEREGTGGLYRGSPRLEAIVQEYNRTPSRFPDTQDVAQLIERYDRAWQAALVRNAGRGFSVFQPNRDTGRYEYSYSRTLESFPQTEQDFMRICEELYTENNTTEHPSDWYGTHSIMTDDIVVFHDEFPQAVTWNDFPVYRYDSFGTERRDDLLTAQMAARITNGLTVKEEARMWHDVREEADMWGIPLAPETLQRGTDLENEYMGVFRLAGIREVRQRTMRDFDLAAQQQGQRIERILPTETVLEIRNALRKYTNFSEYPENSSWAREEETDIQQALAEYRVVENTICHDADKFFESGYVGFIAERLPQDGWYYGGVSGEPYGQHIFEYDHLPSREEVISDYADWEAMQDIDRREAGEPLPHREEAANEYVMLPVDYPVNVNGTTRTHFIRAINNTGEVPLPLNYPLYAGTEVQCQRVLNDLNSGRMTAREAAQLYSEEAERNALAGETARQSNQSFAYVAIESTEDYEDGQLFTADRGTRQIDVQNQDGTFGQTYANERYRIVTYDMNQGGVYPLDYRVFNTAEEARAAIAADTTLRQIDYDTLINRAGDRTADFRRIVISAMEAAGYTVPADRTFSPGEITFANEFGTDVQTFANVQEAYNWLSESSNFTDPEPYEKAQLLLRSYTAIVQQEAQLREEGFRTYFSPLSREEIANLEFTRMTHDTYRFGQDGSRSSIDLLAWRPGADKVREIPYPVHIERRGVGALDLQMLTVAGQDGDFANVQGADGKTLIERATEFTNFASAMRSVNNSHSVRDDLHLGTIIHNITTNDMLVNEHTEAVIDAVRDNIVTHAVQEYQNAADMNAVRDTQWAVEMFMQENPGVLDERAMAEIENGRQSCMERLGQPYERDENTQEYYRIWNGAYRDLTGRNASLENVNHWVEQINNYAAQTRGLDNLPGDIDPAILYRAVSRWTAQQVAEQYRAAMTAEDVYKVNTALEGIGEGVLTDEDYSFVHNERQQKEREVGFTMPENQYSRMSDPRLGDWSGTANELYNAAGYESDHPERLDAIHDILLRESQLSTDDTEKARLADRAEEVRLMAAVVRADNDPEIDTSLYKVAQIQYDYHMGINSGLDDVEISDGLYLSTMLDRGSVVLSVRDNTDPERPGTGAYSMPLEEFKKLSQRDFDSLVGQIYAQAMVYEEPEREPEREPEQTEQERQEQEAAEAARKAQEEAAKARAAQEAARPHGEEGSVQDKKERLAEMLSQGVRDVMDSEKYRAWLDTSSHFFTSGYSFRNALLIWAQKPDATYAMGYEAWKDYGRAVQKGTHGAQIYVPVLAYEKTDGALFRMIKSSLQKQLKDNPTSPFAAYRVGTSALEFTLTEKGLWGLKVHGKEAQQFPNEQSVKQFIQRNVLNKVPMYFTVGNVFDVKDTAIPEYLWVKKGFTKEELVRDDNGKPIKNRRGEYKIVNTPERQARFVTRLSGKVVEKDPAKMAILLDALKAVAERNGVPVHEVAKADDKTLAGGASGYFSRLTNDITLDSGLPPTEKCSVLIHEMAHADLHGDLEKLAQIMGEKATRNMREVQAESVAYAVARQFQLDPGTSSFEYVASWSNGVELQDLNKSLEVIYMEAKKLTRELTAELDVRGLNIDLSEKEKAALNKETVQSLTTSYMTRAVAADDKAKEMLPELMETAKRYTQSVELTGNLEAQYRAANEQIATASTVRDLCTQLEKATDRGEQDAIVAKLDACMERFQTTDNRIAELSDNFIALAAEQKPGRYEHFMQNPSAVLSELRKEGMLPGLSEIQVEYLAKSKYVKSELSQLLKQDNTGQAFAEAATARAQSIPQIAARNGSFVEINYCEQWTDKPIVRGGALMHPNVANSIIKQGEAQCFKLAREAEKVGEYFPYTKCNLTVFSLNADKALQAYITRVDIGDGSQRSLTDFLHQETGKDSPLSKTFDSAIREPGAKEKILFNEPPQEPHQQEAERSEEEKTDDVRLSMDEAKALVDEQVAEAPARDEQDKNKDKGKEKGDR